MDEPILDIGVVESPQQFHQLGILVLDGSGSMKSQGNSNITRADEVNIAVRELLTRFKISRVKLNFSFSAIKFDTKASTITPVTPAESIDDNANFDPTPGHGGGTLVAKGLEAAYKMAEDFLNNAPSEGVPHSVIILLMTDGECHRPEESKQFANTIKSGPHSGKITICTTFFAKKGQTNDAAKNLLRDLASDPVLGFKEIYDADTLRNFFERSITSASGVNI